MPGESLPGRSQRHTYFAGRPRSGERPRRKADRYYIAVVAAEARRLARQLRTPVPPTRLRPEGSH